MLEARWGQQTGPAVMEVAADPASSFQKLKKKRKKSPWLAVCLQPPVKCSSSEDPCRRWCFEELPRDKKRSWVTQRHLAGRDIREAPFVMSHRASLKSYVLQWLLGVHWLATDAGCRYTSPSNLSIIGSYRIQQLNLLSVYYFFCRETFFF